VARILITGMSGTGKSTLLAELHRRGHLTVNTDFLERVASRTNSPYGKTAEQQAEIAFYLETVEPLLRQGATIELDGLRPTKELADVVEGLLNG
jgi:adenylate kinase family enzyme